MTALEQRFADQDQAASTAIVSTIMDEMSDADILRFDKFLDDCANGYKPGLMECAAQLTPGLTPAQLALAKKADNMTRRAEAKAKEWDFLKAPTP